MAAEPFPDVAETMSAAPSERAQVVDLQRFPDTRPVLREARGVGGQAGIAIQRGVGTEIAAEVMAAEKN
jgi:hypothetical protein